MVLPPNERVESALPEEFAGCMFYVTGLYGIGKTRFAMAWDDPRNILFIDFESKGKFWDQQLHFGKYLDLPAIVTAEKGILSSPIEQLVFLQTWTSKKESIPKDRFTVAILDNTGPLQQAAEAEVNKNPSKYGVNLGFGGKAWPGVSYIFGNVLDFLFGRGIRLIIVTTHLGNKWTKSGPLEDKYEAKGVRILQERSVLSLVLFDGEHHPPIPSGLVYKEQLASVRWNPETKILETQRRLPLRLPQATPEAIREYLRNPANLKEPKPGEVPTEKELEMYGQKLSSTQVDYLRQVAIARASSGSSEVEE